MTDVPSEVHGCLVVGRLKGAAYRIAMKVRVRRQDGTTLTSDEAVNAPPEPFDQGAGCGPYEMCTSEDVANMVLDEGVRAEFRELIQKVHNKVPLHLKNGVFKMTAWQADAASGFPRQGR